MTVVSKYAGVILSGFTRIAGQRLMGSKIAAISVDQEKFWQRLRPYQPEAWRDDDGVFPENIFSRRRGSNPDIWEQTRVLELLGRVNYTIIKGKRVYVEVGGVVYKTLYGGYWRSVFTGVEHYLLRCEQVSGSIWAEEETRAAKAVDLPIAYSNDGWTASGYSLSFMLSRE